MRSFQSAIAGMALAAALPATGLAAETDGAIDAVIPVPEQAPADGTSAATGGEPHRIQNRAVEEVVVTAQKREENLQEVPISIQAFSGDALAARGVATTEQLGQTVPALQFTNVAGFTLIFMRGIGTDNFIPSADPSIATYIDGIYIPAGHSIAQSLGNVKRVEVLKGPQGTLFGRNSTGGAISIVTEDPGRTFQTSLEGEVGSYDTRSAKASVTLPMSDWLSVGVAGLLSYKTNYYRNIYYDVPTDVLRAGRVKLHIQPIDDLSINLTNYLTRQQGLGSVLGKNTNPSPLGTLVGIQPSPDDFNTNSDLHSAVRGGQRITYGNLNWTLPWFDFKVLGSDEYILTDFASIDFDGSPIPIAAFDVSNEYTRMKTAEVQFVSNSRTPGADVFKWVAGLYYLKSTAGMDPAHLEAAPQACQSVLNIAGLQGSALEQNLLNLTSLLPAGNTPLQDGGLQVAFSGLLGTKSYSAFVQGTYYFTDWLDLTLGARFQKEKRYLEKSNTRLSNLTGGDGSTINLFDPNGSATLLSFDLKSADASNVSPKAVLSLHPSEDTMIYASYSVGFKSGTYNVVNIYTPPKYIVPEKVTTYELGAKLDLLGHDLRLNGAIFQNNITDLQSGFVSLLSGGAVQFLTAGSARTRGAEFDFVWLPMPDLNPGLAITGNAAYVDATYTSFTDGQGFSPTTGLYQTGQNFSGNQIVRSPKVSGGIGAVQTLSVASGSFEFAVDDYYNSGFYYDAENTVKEDPYTVLNGRIGYLHDAWNLRLTLYGQNLLDRRYHIQQFQNDFGIIKTLAPPRQYGLRVNWDF